MGPALLFSTYAAIGLVAALVTRETWGPRERKLADEVAVRDRRPTTRWPLMATNDADTRRQKVARRGIPDAPPRPEHGGGAGPGLRRSGARRRRHARCVYAHQLRYRPEDPDWEGRDRFLLSTGHYAIGLYAALAEAGIIDVAELDSYGSDGSRLPMSGMASYTPGMEISGGSLGHGLTVAVGMALGLRHQGSAARVINFLSDGELDEGSTWEAAMGASHHQLGNLIAMVDINALQADGPTAGVLRTEPVADKWVACGWFAQRVDGNDVEALLAAFDRRAAPNSSVRLRSSCATPGSAVACRCWRTARRRTSCASTPTSGRSAESS